MNTPSIGKNNISSGEIDQNIVHQNNVVAPPSLEILPPPPIPAPVDDGNSNSNLGYLEDRISLSQQARKRTMGKVMELRTKNQKESGGENDQITGKKRRRRLDHLTVDEKIKRRRMRNREAAQRSREKKKDKMKKLEGENSEMERKIRELEDQNHGMLSILHSIRPDWSEMNPFPLDELELQYPGILSKQVVPDLDIQSPPESGDHLQQVTETEFDSSQVENEQNDEKKEENS